MTRKKTTRKHKPASLKYYVSNFSDYNTITEQPKTKAFVYMNLVKAIQVGLEEKVESVDLFRLDDSNVSLSLPKEGWKSSLENAIDFFSRYEMFETCAKCKKLIDVL